MLADMQKSWNRPKQLFWKVALASSYRCTYEAVIGFTSCTLRDSSQKVKMDIKAKMYIKV